MRQGFGGGMRLGSDCAAAECALERRVFVYVDLFCARIRPRSWLSSVGSMVVL